MLTNQEVDVGPLSCMHCRQHWGLQPCFSLCSSACEHHVHTRGKAESAEGALSSWKGVLDCPVLSVRGAQLPICTRAVHALA